jgi:hypothetical protein
MSVFPVVFTPNDTTIITEDTTNLSIFFEPIPGFTFTKRPIPFLPSIMGIQLFIPGKFIEPSFAFTRNRRTQTYLLETLYLSPLCPTLVTDKLNNPTRNSLIIKGSITENGVTQHILLYIPFEPQTLDANVQVDLFDEANKAILNAINNEDTKVTGATIDLNNMVPKTPYHYYEILVNGQKNVVLFFESSSILLDPSLGKMIPMNSVYNKNITNRTFTLYESVNPPEMKRVTTGMEDSIYIDCMPVDLVNEDKKTYMKKMPTLKGPNGLPVIPMPNIQGLNYATDLIDQTTSYLERSTHYILFLVFLILMVFLIFSIKKMFESSSESAVEDIMPLLKEIQKKVAR